VRFALARAPRAAKADRGFRDDDRGTIGLLACRHQSPVQTFEIPVAIDGLDVPTLGFEAARDIFAEADRCRPIDRDLVVVLEIDQVPEAQVTRERTRLGGDPFHQVAIADDPVHKVVSRPLTIG
jgi:hypothetical protein